MGEGYTKICHSDSGRKWTFREAFVLLTARRQNIVATRCTPIMCKMKEFASCMVKRNTCNAEGSINQVVK